MAEVHAVAAQVDDAAANSLRVEESVQETFTQVTIDLKKNEDKFVNIFS